MSGLVECTQDVHGIMQEAEGHEEIRGHGLDGLSQRSLPERLIRKQDPNLCAGKWKINSENITPCST